MNDTLLRLRRLATVPRWAVVSTIRNQSVAEHSFHVATLCLWLGPLHDDVYAGNTSMGDVLTSALRHDEMESISGDVPSPIKPHMEGTSMDMLGAKLDLDQYGCSLAIKQIVKVADVLEALIFLNEEMGMGNKSVLRIQRSIYPSLVSQWTGFNYKKGREKPTAAKIMQEAINIFDPETHPALDHI